MSASALQQESSTLSDHCAALADVRQEWLDQGDIAFLNFAGHAAMPLAAVEAAHASALSKAKPYGPNASDFFATSEHVRLQISELIGARSRDVALTTGAGAAMSIIAHGLMWRPGDEIVVAAGDFPVHAATWGPVAARHGARLITVGAANEPLVSGHVLEALSHRTRLISLSHVNSDNGAILDVAPIANECRRRDIRFLIDMAQSCGALPIDVGALGADYAVGVGYKYLLGPWGAGFLWVAPHRQDELQPAPWSWINQDVTSFSQLVFIDPKPASGARRWDGAEMAGPFNLNLAALSAGLDVVKRLTPQRVLQHASDLIQALYSRLPEPLAAVSPSDARRRGAFGCIRAESAEATLDLYRTLLAAGVIVSFRRGIVRVSPHLLNSLADIERCLDVMRVWCAGRQAVAGREGQP